MITNRSLLFIITLPAFLWMSCSGDQPKDPHNNGTVIANSSISYINAPNGGAQYPIGKPVTLELVLRSQPEDLEQVLMLVEKDTVYTSTEKKEKHSFSYMDTSGKLGTRKFKTLVVRKNGEKEEQSSSFTFISDLTPVDYTYKIVATYPHDPEAYTQGLVIDQGVMYEGTGLEGRSELRIVDRTNGGIRKQVPLESRYFGEGITVLGNKVYQLTYRTKTGFVYDKKTLNKEKEFNYDTEGWGLTHNGSQLIYSDGSHRLYFLDPSTLEKTETLEVYDDRGPQMMLNELEYINGEIWANVYQTNFVVRIDPKSGKILGRINFEGLLKPEDIHPSIDVLNGIAYDSSTGKIYITGKNYPKLWEVSIQPIAL